MVKIKINKIERKILRIIYINNLQGKKSVSNIQRYLDIEKKELDRNIAKMKTMNLIKQVKKNYILTDKGRKNIIIVFTGGVYDIIHPGHIHTLKKSKDHFHVLQKQLKILSQ